MKISKAIAQEPTEEVKKVAGAFVVRVRHNNQAVKGMPKHASSYGARGDVLRMAFATQEDKADAVAELRAQYFIRTAENEWVKPAKTEFVKTWCLFDTKCRNYEKGLCRFMHSKRVIAKPVVVERTEKAIAPVKVEKKRANKKRTETPTKTEKFTQKATFNMDGTYSFVVQEKKPKVAQKKVIVSDTESTQSSTF